MEEFLLAFYYYWECVCVGGGVPVVFGGLLFF